MPPKYHENFNPFSLLGELTFTARYVDALKIKDVIFNDPATIVLWEDGTKTVVKCGENDTFSKEHGLAMCICKKALGNKGNYNEVFKKWLKEDDNE